MSKTLIESFDGSQSFFRRAGRAYRTPLFYVRGIAVGLGAWYALSHDFFALATARRIELGAAVGVLAYAGVSLLGDALLAGRSRGRIRSWRAYLVEALLGGFIGAGLGFYLDTSQVPVVLKKFQLYNSFGLKPVGDDFCPLLSKWGRIQLGPYAGGAKLLFNESLKGVIGWGVADWLFAVNRSLLLAIFQRETVPLRRMFSREGMAELTDGTVHVLRWGLWMAPIIFTFLRQMPVPTWYNQDGAIHTGFCIVNDLTMKPEQFREWNLRVFTWVLGYDLFCVLIWLDHMGLRVATLVNLSFLGMDRLDEKAARFVRPWATARCIPEGVKRFTTWAPLLIPFYIPAGGLGLGLDARRSDTTIVARHRSGTAGLARDATGLAGDCGRRRGVAGFLCTSPRDGRPAGRIHAGGRTLCRDGQGQRRTAEQARFTGVRRHAAILRSPRSGGLRALSDRMYSSRSARGTRRFRRARTPRTN